MADTLSLPAMPHDEIKLGSFLLTIVEPHRGHEVAYNRWYERDHFYSGCMIGPWTLAGGRFVATRDCKVHRLPNHEAPGSYMALYWIQDGRYPDWIEWAGAQVGWLHKNGRMFAERDHIHTQMYRYLWGAFRDEDGVPPELALDHGYAGVIAVFGDVADGVEPDAVHEWYRDDQLPTMLRGSPIAMCLVATPRPLQEGPADVPRAEGTDRKFVHLYFVDEDPREVWVDHFANHAAALEASGLGTIGFASPFLATVPGTDTYTDQLW